MRPKSNTASIIAILGISSALFAANELAVTVTTINPMGTYNPANIVAMWIQDNSGQFVRTFGKWAAERESELLTWNSANGGNTSVCIDGVTAATRTSHGTISSKWDLSNASGQRVPNGNYWYYIEMTDRNNRQGPVVKGHIAIDGTSETRTGIDSSFNSGSTYLTNVIAAYTENNAVIHGLQSGYRDPSNRLRVPADYRSATIGVRLTDVQGRTVWYGSVPASPGAAVPVSSIKSELSAGHGLFFLSIDAGIPRIAELTAVIR
jgi:hypothetical protein